MYRPTISRPVFSNFTSVIKGKKVAVLGIGISHQPLVPCLCAWGAKVSIFDQRLDSEPEIQKLQHDYAKQGLELEWFLGADYLEHLVGHDLIFKTPVVHPEIEPIRRAVEAGAKLTTEMEVFVQYCPAPIIGITGSDGKTTTTTLISKALKNAGYKVHVGGNIGTPLLPEIEQITKDEWVVLELSSFQLLTMRQSPEIAVITNITPNHLNVHKDLAEYIEAKHNIMRWQDAQDRVVLNWEDANCRSFAQTSKAHIVWFDAHLKTDAEREQLAQKIPLNLTVDQPIYSWSKTENQLYTDANEPLFSRELIKLPGDYNVANYLATLACTKEIVEPAVIAALAQEFGGVEHRVELIAEHHGVKFYNSSIDSSPQRTKATLSAFNSPLILLVGGKDKACDYTGLGKAIFTKTKRLILCGENGSLIKANLKQELTTEEFAELKIAEAIDYNEAVDIALNWAETGDSVLLSPAGTSFDRFANFMKRGEAFKQAVRDGIKR